MGKPAATARKKKQHISLVARRPGRDGFYENFSVKGRRFRDSLGTDDKEEAERIAAQRLAEALQGRVASPARASKTTATEITLTAALGRYWQEVGQFAATSDDIARNSRALNSEIGAETRLSAITFGVLSAFAARRRVRKRKNGEPIKDMHGQIVLRANATVNRELGHLRTVMLAAKRWGYRIGDIEWRRVMLDEPENVQTILSETREDQFFAVLRPDYHPLALFALASGVRLENAIGLTWGQIDWDARTITFRTKSRKPGKKLLVLPLTDELAGILATERAHHPTPDDPAAIVFTYVCRRNRHDRHHGVMQQQGERYPFTHDGWRKEWMRARTAIGLPQLRFHDLRHTAATRALIAAGGNLKVVQRMLGHADVSTTLRYLSADVADLAAAMGAMRRRAPQPVCHQNLTPTPASRGKAS